MSTSRKRRTSEAQEPQNPRLKKLKDHSDICLDQPSSEPANEAKKKLSKLLPDGYDSIIVTASTKSRDTNVGEGHEDVFGCVRLPILTKEDAFRWLKKFEKKTFTSYRSEGNWKCDATAFLNKNKFLCAYRNPNWTSEVDSCKASLIFTIKDAREIATNPDYYLRDFPSQVIIQFCHNHQIDAKSYLATLRPTKDLSDAFFTYYLRGHSPFSALICHKCDLHSSYGPEFYNVVSSSGICPPYSWCSKEYEKLFSRTFSEPGEEKLTESLQESIRKYNDLCGFECAILTKNNNLLSISTPLMKSVFESGFAEDLITVRCFSVAKSPRSERRHLILFLCHTPIGSLPFGIVLTRNEQINAACDGIRTLLSLLGMPSYKPNTIIVDENNFAQNILKRAFPTSQIIFNEFQMLQSIWRIIRLVCEDDHEEFQTLYNLFLVILNSSTEEEFDRNFDNLQIYAEKFPQLNSFVEYFKSRSHHYVYYSRPKVEFNIDVLNYTDSGTIILQDVSAKYGNHFNIQQIFDFITKNYDTHYERKLVKIVEGDLKGFFKTNFFVDLSQIPQFSCSRVSDTEFLVELNSIKFFVNAELDTCTCEIAVNGGSCVHQYIVEKDLGLVPECYTPLGEDMLAILKSILAHKQSINNGKNVAKVQCEGKDTTGHMCASQQPVSTPMDSDNVVPIDEICVPLADISSCFVNYELEEAPEESYVVADENINIPEVGQSVVTNEPEEHIEDSMYGIDNLSDGFNDNIGQNMNPEIDKPGDETSSCVEQLEPVSFETAPNVENLATGSDEKRVEIAEFLTNLPDTNSFSSSTTTTQTGTLESENKPANIEDIRDQFPDHIEIITEEDAEIEEGSYFADYDVLENGNLTIATNHNDDYVPYPNTKEKFIDSYEDERNLVLMSPSDIFESPEKDQSETKSSAESKINILSSIVIKPDIEKVPLKVLKALKKSNVSIKRLQSGPKQPKLLKGPLVTKINEVSVRAVSGPKNVVSFGGKTFKTVNINNKVALSPLKSTQAVATKGLLTKGPKDKELKSPLKSDEISNINDKSTAQMAKKEKADIASDVERNVQNVSEIDSDDLDQIAAKTETNDYVESTPETESILKPPDVSNLLESQLSTAFTQLKELAVGNKYKESVTKFLEKFKELNSSGKLVSALENFGCDNQPVGEKNRELVHKAQSPGPIKVSNSDLFEDSDYSDYPEYEHYSFCSSDCSEFHSELEPFDDEDFQAILQQEYGSRGREVTGEETKGETLKAVRQKKWHDQDKAKRINDAVNKQASKLLSLSRGRMPNYYSSTDEELLPERTVSRVKRKQKLPVKEKPKNFKRSNLPLKEGTETSESDSDAERQMVRSRKFGKTNIRNNNSKNKCKLENTKEESINRPEFADEKLTVFKPTIDNTMSGVLKTNRVSILMKLLADNNKESDREKGEKDLKKIERKGATSKTFKGKTNSEKLDSEPKGISRRPSRNKNKVKTVEKRAEKNESASRINAKPHKFEAAKTKNRHIEIESKESGSRINAGVAEHHKFAAVKTKNRYTEVDNNESESRIKAEVAEPHKLEAGKTKNRHIEELEHILTGNDVDIVDKSNSTEVKESLIDNEELSFLFNDPRFEAVVMDAEEPGLTVSELPSSPDVSDGVKETKAHRTKSLLKGLTKDSSMEDNSNEEFDGINMDKMLTSPNTSRSRLSVGQTKPHPVPANALEATKQHVKHSDSLLREDWNIRDRANFDKVVTSPNHSKNRRVDSVVKKVKPQSEKAPKEKAKHYGRTNHRLVESGSKETFSEIFESPSETKKRLVDVAVGKSRSRFEKAVISPKEATKHQVRGKDSSVRNGSGGDTLVTSPRKTKSLHAAADEGKIKPQPNKSKHITKVLSGSRLRHSDTRMILAQSNLGYEDIYKKFLEGMSVDEPSFDAASMDTSENSSVTDSDDSEIREFSKSKRKSPKIKPRSKKAALHKLSESPKLELIVLIERNMEVEEKCRRTQRGKFDRRERKGYKELLENAKRLKFV